MITVKASKHPFVDDFVTAEVEPNQTIYEICGTDQIHVWIDGKSVDYELYHTLKIQDNTELVVRPVPADGGTLNTVLQIGAMVAAAYLAGPIAGALGWGAFGKGMIALGLSLTLSMAVNALVPIPQPDLGDYGQAGRIDRLASLTGPSNQVARFKPIPRLYGRYRYYPPIPMTAMPFTEIEGSDQYLRMMLVLGYGPLDIGGVVVGRQDGTMITEQTALTGTPIRIGETDIHEFDDVEFQIGPWNYITLYSDEVIETVPAWTTNSDVSGIAADAGGQWVTNGDVATRTTEFDADEISITLEGILFCINSKGRTKEAKIEWKIEYAPTGTSNWTVLDDAWVTTSQKRETARFGRRWKVPRGQYDVKITRVRTYFADFEAVQDKMTWTALRTIRTNTPWAVDNTVVMAIRIKANDQLNGTLDDLSVEATSVLPVWNGSTWVEQPTRNPAWVYADIWTGTANRRPLSKDRLDTQALLDWANDCDARGFHYDNVFDSTGTTVDRAKEVASNGRASWNITTDAKISVVRDIPQTIPKMIIGPRNSYGLQYSLNAADTPDALRVQFIDSETWENAERFVFDDGYDESNAQKYETLQAKGVTDPEHAWKFGRYNLAQLKLRPETFTFNQDVQHLRYNRGDLIEYRHDVIAVGLADGRVKSVTKNASGQVTSFMSDEFLSMPDASKTYGIKVQRQDGSIITVNLINETPGTYEPTLVEPVDFNIGDYFLFGESGKESLRLKVTAIEPEGDLKARITCVPEAPNIHDADTGEIPPYDPTITQPANPDMMPLPIPEIIRITSDESVLIRDTDGSFRSRLVVESKVASFPGWNGARQVRYRPYIDDGETPLAWEFTSISTKDAISIYDIEQDVTYDIQIRSVRGSKVSPWSTLHRYHIPTPTLPPKKIQGLEAVTTSDGIAVTWEESTDPDIDHYIVKIGDVWDSQGDYLITRNTKTIIPVGSANSVTIMVKAVNTSGLESVEASSVTVEIQAIAISKVEETAYGWAFAWNNVKGIKGYNLYIDSELVAEDFTSSVFEYRENLQEGIHSFTVAAVDIYGVETNRKDSVNFEVNYPQVSDLRITKELWGYLLEWNAPEGVINGYNIYIDDEMINKEYQGTSFSWVRDFSDGQHEFAIRVVNKYGKESLEKTHVEFDATGESLIDAAQSDDITYQIDSNGYLTVTWDTLEGENDPQIAYYEIRVSSNDVSSFDNATYLTKTTSNTFTHRINPITMQKVFIAGLMLDGTYTFGKTFINLQVLDKPKLSIDFTDGIVLVDWQDIKDAKTYELTNKIGNISSRKFVRQSQYSFGFSRYPRYVTIRAWGDKGFSETATEEINTYGLYKYNYVFDTNINFVNGEYHNFAFLDDNTVVRPSVFGLPLNLPIQNINDSDLFNFIDKFNDIQIADIQDAKVNWFRTNWYGKSDGYFVSDVYDLGAVYTGKILGHLNITVTNYSESSNIWEIETYKIDEYTIFELLDTELHIDVDFYVSTDGINWNIAKTESITKARYLQVKGSILDASPLDEIIISECHVQFDQQDIEEEGNIILSGTTGTIVLTKSYNVIKFVLLNAVGDANNAHLISTDITDGVATINIGTDIADSEVYYYVKGY